VLGWWDESFAWRLGLAVALFATLGVRDRLRHPEDPRRAKEYLFLAFAGALAVAYGVAHDHVTATISREYFWRAKGLVYDPRPFRRAVTVLAARASLGPGLLAGAALLLANNPAPARPSLGYPALARLALVPLAAAAGGAALGSALFAADVFELREAAVDFAGNPGATRFLVVWGIHAGSYAGAAIGTAAAVVLVRKRRRRAAAAAALDREARERVH
jgi:hypothetical protein